MPTVARINKWIADWKNRGYPDDIPDEVPAALMRNNLAPCYKTIAIAILKNDMHMEALGFTPKKSKWYSVLKRIEIEERNRDNP